ncbi:hypothetical protein AK812_SmicGene7714 [Symbiodinium microadriaticum]|uniref:Uncharacterized protein n=1 Tax=Symbiodinium microadriaticum TaxID=2951 RepID=A0A1Q9EMS1_SYMMI|nr:hypothetical protein AK812_SmicGene7714 [Symbiodinium microadriaticum]
MGLARRLELGQLPDRLHRVLVLQTRQPQLQIGLKKKKKKRRKEGQRAEESWNKQCCPEQSHFIEKLQKKVSSDLHHWMLRSLHEVNRSAHPTGHPRSRQSLMHAEPTNVAFKKWVSEEELVELPEGSPDVPDPPFTFVIAHLFSHIFSLETCA